MESFFADANEQLDIARFHEAVRCAVPREQSFALDARAPPFFPSVAHASVAMAISFMRAELHAVARLWAAGSEMQPRRSGGRQRRAARWRGRRVRECYVGAVQAAERFEERAEMHGWFTSDGSGSDSDYYSAVED